MNELQQTELELLKEFIKICQQLNLKYYLICGSALGAVKYRGFIPWDDDIDVALPREDYEAFIHKAQGLLSENIFVQNYLTEPRFPKCFTKLRKTDTTYIEKSSQKLPIHHGVFIDIFPLDGYPADTREQQYLEKLKKRYKLRLSCAFSYRYNLKARLFFFVERFFGVHKRTQKYTKLLDKLISAYSTEESKIWCNHGNWQGKLDYAPKEWFGEGTKAEFEGLSVVVPEEYDKYLTQKYGDWRSDPPQDEQRGHHDAVICDVTRPYTQYLIDGNIVK